MALLYADRTVSFFYLKQSEVIHFCNTEILPGAVAVVAGLGRPLCYRSHLQAGQDHGPGSLKVKTTLVTSGSVLF
jgi:hypothetical protein